MTKKETTEDRVKDTEQSAAQEPASSSTATDALPPCGLAEDILGPSELEDHKSPLPAFGLAEDILGASAAPALPDAEKEAETSEPEEESQPEDISIQIVTFKLAEEEYALPISEVLEIVRVGEITRVPNSKKHIRGVVNLRGKIVPVVDLRRRLSLGEAAIGKENRIIVVENGPKALGLLVDRVDNIHKISSSEIEEPPEEVAKTHNNSVVGVAKPDEERLVFLLDLEQALQIDSSIGDEK